MTTVDPAAHREHSPSPPPSEHESPPLACMSDLSVALLALISESRGVQADAARANAEAAHKMLERLRQEIQEAMERAEEAAENAGLWADITNVLGSDVATIAGVVAAVALAVATGGTGTAAVLALVAAGLTAGAKVGDELGLDPRATAAMGAAGGAVGLFAGNVGGVGNVWTTTAHVANGVQGLARAGSGATSIVEGEYRADELRAHAEVRQFQGDQSMAWLRFDLAVEELKQASREVERAKGTTSSIVRDEAEGAGAVLARMGAA